MIGDDDSWWWSLADHVVLSCCVVLSCVDLYWIVLTCIKLFSITFPYTVYPNMWKSLMRVGDDRWPIMLYWVVVLYWVVLTCIELCWLVLSCLALACPYTVYPNMWKSLMRVGDDRWPIMLYWVVVLYWVVLTCIELCWLVLSYLALHFLILYILICERALQSAVLGPLRVSSARSVSTECNLL